MWLEVIVATTLYAITGSLLFTSGEKSGLGVRRERYEAALSSDIARFESPPNAGQPRVVRPAVFPVIHRLGHRPPFYNGRTNSSDHNQS